MKLNDEVLNELFRITVEHVNANYKYDNDINHLLYIIIPAFIIKYGYDNKSKIFKMFDNVPIIRKNNNEKVLQAYYTSLPLIVNNNIITSKYIVLNYYSNKPIIEFIDNIVHEYNHAINSYNNDIKEDDNYIYLRTGLMYIKYNKNNYADNSKDDSYILEEIINTKQTEEIIDIINSFNKYNINNIIISNTLYTIKTSINNSYNSNSYLLQSMLCKKLMDNNTLISVLSNMRFNGIIDEIPYFFDNITGIDNSYNELIKILNDSVDLEIKYSKSKLFKNNKLIKLRKLYNKAEIIIDSFNSNYHFK